MSTSLLNESCDGDAEDETLPELADNPGTTRGTKLSVLQIILFPSWLIVAIDRWPTHKSIRGLRKGCLATGLQAFPRVIARLEKDLDRERILCLLVGMHLTTYSQYHRGGRGFWTFSLCPSLPSLIFFCKSRALMLLNRLRILAPLVCLKWVPASPLLQQDYKTFALSALLSL